MSIWSSLLNLILPPRCIKCGTILSEHNGICADCFQKINFISEPMCRRCGQPFSELSLADNHNNFLCGKCLQDKKHLFVMQRSAFIYDDYAKQLIFDLKFRDKTQNASVLANLLFSAGYDIWQQNPDLLLAVPLHRLRLLQRRYNQSALLVKYLSSKTNIKADYKSFVRTENTIPQVQLSGHARRSNLRHAFMVKYPQNIKDKRIVLVDDVRTTGSTLNECAKVLLKAGAKEIYALTLARTEE